MSQEQIALGIVTVTVLGWVLSGIRGFVLPVLSRFLLRHERVALAFLIKKLEK